MPKNTAQPFLYFLLLIIILQFTACLDFSQSYKEQADQYRKSQEYEDAIVAYEKHIADRLAVKRHEWENPYIYYLDIGDIYLDQGNVTKAIEYYELAEKNGVKQSYCNDRYRSVALWYETQGDLKKSLEILKKYQDKDPFLIDLMLDRLAKQLVAEEDAPLEKQPEREATKISAPTTISDPEAQPKN